MKTLLVGDRLGGVLFDVQQYRAGMISNKPFDHRTRLIACIANLVELVEANDEAALKGDYISQAQENTNPRIDDYPRCEDREHDRYGQRKTDCSECLQSLLIGTV